MLNLLKVHTRYQTICKYDLNSKSKKNYNNLAFKGYLYVSSIRDSI